MQIPHNWRPRAYQRPLWDYLERGGRHAVAVWHRRAGKDEIALHRTCVAAHERVGNYWHMLPEYAQARKAMWDAINPHSGRRRIDEAFPLELREGKANEHEMKIKFKSGSIWQLVGSDNFNALIGSPPVGIVYSEWAVADPRSHGYLRPILAENGGWSMFIYTSRGYNHGFTTYQAALDQPGSFAQRLRAEDTSVFTAEQLADERRAYRAEYGQHDGDALYRQEYECDFSAANVGAILGRYVETAENEGRITDDVEFDLDGPGVEISSDIGFRDTAAWWFWQARPDGYALVDYDEDSGNDAQEWIPRLQAKGYPIARIHLPFDAKSKTFATQHSAQEQFWEAFGIDKINIVPQTTKAARVNAARTVMPRCHFNRTRCKEGLSGLRSWSYKYDHEKKTFSKEPEHDWASHPGDSFSYGALIMRERIVSSEKPKEPKFDDPRTMTFNELVAHQTKKRKAEEALWA